MIHQSPKTRPDQPENQLTISHGDESRSREDEVLGCFDSDGLEAEDEHLEPHQLRKSTPETAENSAISAQVDRKQSQRTLDMASMPKAPIWREYLSMNAASATSCRKSTPKSTGKRRKTTAKRSVASENRTRGLFSNGYIHLLLGILALVLHFPRLKRQCAETLRHPSVQEHARNVLAVPGIFHVYYNAGFSVLAL